MRKIGANKLTRDFKNNESKGFKKENYYDTSKLGENIEIYKPVEGVNRVNILPYVIKTDNHPDVAAGLVEKGDMDYVLDVWVHKNIGERKKDIVCLKKTYGKACPLCEENKRLYDSGDLEASKEIMAKRRVMYNIQPTVGEQAGKILFWEQSHFFFQTPLINEANACVDGEDPVIFYEMGKEGSVVQFRGVKEKFSGKEFLKFEGFRFKERDKEVEESIVNKTFSLDKALNVLTYDEIYDYYFGTKSDSEEERSETQEEKPSIDEEKEIIEEETITPVKEEIKSECPFGHKYGIDFEMRDDCDSCDKWTDCRKKRKEMNS